LIVRQVRVERRFSAAATADKRRKLGAMIFKMFGRLRRANCCGEDPAAELLDS
jgi:hypothetical protein